MLMTAAYADRTVIDVTRRSDCKGLWRSEHDAH